MKTRNLFSSLVLLFFLFNFMACTKEEPVDPCLEVYCDHGTCIDGTCECDEFHTGESCQDLRVPTQITGQRVQLKHIPYPCRRWDGASIFDNDADIYIQILKGNTVIYNTRDLHLVDTDCLYEGSCFFDRPLILEPKTTYELRVYDYDEGFFDADDLISTRTFKPWDYMSSYYKDPSEQRLLKVEQSCSSQGFGRTSPYELILFDLEFTF